MANVTHTGYLDNDYGGDDYLEGSECALLGMQVGFAYAFAGMQVGEQVNTSVAMGMQFKSVEQKHREHGEYLEDSYLGYGDDYLAEKQCVIIGMQVNQQIPSTIGMQVEQSIYNTCAFRILCTFTSRGTEALGGTNWTSTNTATGDFSANNLNTDIVEQVFRSTSTTVTLTVDTGVAQGVGIDTLAFINHNLTSGAIVQLQGSDDNFVSAPNFTTNLEVTAENLYYIAESIPNAAQTNRYWRFVIQDDGNSDGYVQIGTVVFGTADIFVKDGRLGCADDPIGFGKKHFKDEVPTDGFTNVMNDRTTKRFLKIGFSKILVVGEEEGIGANFNIIKEYTCFAKTSTKCLIVPTPGTTLEPSVIMADRFAVFSKLTRLPEYSYRSAGPNEIYATFRLEWDESL